MCGIFGMVEKTPSPGELLANYQGMSKLLNHRGPDACGVAKIPLLSSKMVDHPVKTDKDRFFPGYIDLKAKYFDNSHGFLGHHRLSIIDLDEEAHQPFIDEEGQVLLVLNGEIYNYLELREELKALGCKFYTTSDTEVALHAYKQWDSECFKKFNGDFAILIYDHRKKAVVGARDRIGVKPLFYTLKGNNIAFASEVKGFLDISWFKPELNEEVAYHFLVADFPLPKTINKSFLKDVNSIPPGNCFELSLQSFELRCCPYWQLEDKDTIDLASSEEKKIIEEFDFLFRDAVKIRLRSDVPVGSFLSGGMDSTSIVWQAVNQGHNIPTFSSTFSNPEYDETEYIDLMTKQLNLENHKLLMNSDEFIDEIDELVYLQDEPFSVLNVYSQYVNLKLAKKYNIKVVLDGGGADEYLAGYADYFIPALVDTNCPPDNLSANQKKRYEQFVQMDQEKMKKSIDEAEKSRRRISYISPECRKKIRGNSDSLDIPFPSNYKYKFRNSYLKHALKHSMSDAWFNKSIIWANRYLDRSGMFLGLEVRVPFQDHRLVDFIFNLPPGLLYGNNYSKYILRKVMEKRLPKQIVFNKIKNGFEFPVCELIAENKQFRNYFLSLASETDFQQLNLVDPQKVIKDLNDIVAGKSTNYNIWRVFNLYLWKKKYIYGK